MAESSVFEGWDLARLSRRRGRCQGARQSTVAAAGPTLVSARRWRPGHATLLRRVLDRARQSVASAPPRPTWHSPKEFRQTHRAVVSPSADRSRHRRRPRRVATLGYRLAGITTSTGPAGGVRGQRELARSLARRLSGSATAQVEELADLGNDLSRRRLSQPSRWQIAGGTEVSRLVEPSYFEKSDHQRLNISAQAQTKAMPASIGFADDLAGLTSALVIVGDVAVEQGDAEAGRALVVEVARPCPPRPCRQCRDAPI